MCHFHVWQDLSRLGRDLSQVVIIDNSPASYVLHPENAVSMELVDDTVVAFICLRYLSMYRVSK